MAGTAQVATVGSRTRPAIRGVFLRTLTFVGAAIAGYLLISAFDGPARADRAAPPEAVPLLQTLTGGSAGGLPVDLDGPAVAIPDLLSTLDLIGDRPESDRRSDSREAGTRRDDDRSQKTDIARKSETRPGGDSGRGAGTRRAGTGPAADTTRAAAERPPGGRVGPLLGAQASRQDARPARVVPLLSRITPGSRPEQARPSGPRLALLEPVVGAVLGALPDPVSKIIMSLCSVAGQALAVPVAVLRPVNDLPILPGLLPGWGSGPGAGADQPADPPAALSHAPPTIADSRDPPGLVGVAAATARPPDPRGDTRYGFARGTSSSAARGAVDQAGSGGMPPWHPIGPEHATECHLRAESGGTGARSALAGRARWYPELTAGRVVPGTRDDHPGRVGEASFPPG